MMRYGSPVLCVARGAASVTVHSQPPSCQISVGLISYRRAGVG
jgi:hypothetical protein